MTNPAPAGFFLSVISPAEPDDLYAKVEIAPFAYMRGRTFENAVVILDEAQNVTAAQMKMFLTRLGENVTVIVNGDITQCDLPASVQSGQKAAEALINKDIERIIVTRPVLQADEDLGFLPGDISEKFAPYFRPVYDVLVKRLGASFMQYCLRPERREEESVTSLVQMGGLDAIGMARDVRDRAPIAARNEAQAHYLNAIETKQLIFATGEAGCGKTWISAVTPRFVYQYG
ncbi:hypothetical protein CRX72_20470 [Pantoea sp. BRM17]|nr:hypothetical protein CRX72_20470 [Pantoea sp. BRM17]